MTRVEENDKMCKIAGSFRTNDQGMAALIMVLADISRSLAVMADWMPVSEDGKKAYAEYKYEKLREVDDGK